MANPPDKKALIAELATCRAALTGYTVALRDDFAFRAKFKRSFHANQTAWLGGAAVLGLLLSKLPLTGRKVVTHAPAAKAGKAAFALTALKFGLDFAKPALLRWIKDRWVSRTGTRPSA